MDNTRRRILWADDEIDMLRPHQMFLDERGYEVTPVSNGRDAIALVTPGAFDIVLLDEMMPGLDGLSTLAQIKAIDPNVPVIMITKNEEERLMDQALGRRIDEYLTKPVNPSQIFLACKKLLDSRQIQQNQAGENYSSRIAQIRDRLSGDTGWSDWLHIHRELCEWEVEIGRLGDRGLQQMLADQRRECNRAFARYVEQCYPQWVADEGESPPLSVDVVTEFVVPLLQQGRQVFFMVIDCLRLDHWLVMESVLAEYYTIRRAYHCSILPTATPYARNAIFSGLFPAQIAAKYGDIWQGAQSDDSSLNRFEHRFLDDQLRDSDAGLSGETHYVKVLDAAEGQNLARRAGGMGRHPVVAVAYNFLDMLVHGRSQSELLKEIAPDERAFRSLVESWFAHSTLLEILRQVARTGAAVVLTTDHGSIRSSRATTVHGDRATSSNLRYKVGRNLRVDAKEAVLVRDPRRFGLPVAGLGANFAFAREDFFFVYPTHFNEYQRQFRDSFQHGGISLDEMVLPVAVMEPR